MQLGEEIQRQREEREQRQAEAEGAMEEERRLMYVAMTRAKSRLTLSYYDGLGSVRSRFLDEMLEE